MRNGDVDGGGGGGWWVWGSKEKQKETCWQCIIISYEIVFAQFIFMMPEFRPVSDFPFYKEFSSNTTWWDWGWEGPLHALCWFMWWVSIKRFMQLYVDSFFCISCSLLPNKYRGFLCSMLHYNNNNGNLYSGNSKHFTITLKCGTHEKKKKKKQHSKRKINDMIIPEKNKKSKPVIKNIVKCTHTCRQACTHTDRHTNTNTHTHTYTHACMLFYAKFFLHALFCIRWEALSL